MHLLDQFFYKRVYSQDFLYITIQIGYHCIETIISGSIVYFILVKTVDAFFSNFTICGNRSFFDKTGRIIGIFSFRFLSGLAIEVITQVSKTRDPPRME